MQSPSLDSDRDESANRLASILVSQISGEVPTDVERRSLEALRQRAFSTVPASRRTAARWIVALAAAVVAVTVVLVIGPRLRDPAAEPLHWKVEGADLLSTTYLVAGSSQPARVSFADGSDTALEPAARVRVETQGASVTLVVEDGSIAVHVVPGGRRGWTVAAGPFEVHVTGTRFRLQWEAARGTLDVALEDGRVAITGPLSPGSIEVRAGQRLRADLSARTFSVSELVATAQPSAAAPDVVPSAEPEPVMSSSAAPDAQVRTRVSLAALVARGDFDEVVTRVEARGIESCLASCSVADLRAFGDAARLTGRVDLAQRALLALRRRGGRDQGATAAFLLARIYEGRGQTSTALDWYDRYMAEAQGGGYLAEAMAGRMRALRSLGRAQEARTVAQEYLSRFPSGAHAKAAQALLDGR